MEVELKSPHAHVVRDHYTGYIQKLTSCRSVMAFGKVLTSVPKKDHKMQHHWLMQL